MSTAVESVPIKQWVTSQGSSSGNDTLLLTMHGWSSHERDLSKLFGRFSAETDWVSLRAPYELDEGGAGWFLRTDMEDPDRDLVEAGVASVLDWIDTHASGRRVIPVGFSQGGVMVSELLRHRPDHFPAAVILSGFTNPGTLPGDAELAARRPPVFYGRGGKDEVITPASLVDRTAQWLRDHASLTERVYPALGHGISPKELADLNAFLASVE